jgi:hypothetical protein
VHPLLSLRHPTRCTTTSSLSETDGRSGLRG